MKLSNAALLLLTGIAIGAVAGVLLAPEEGTKMSKKLLKKAKKYKKLLEDKVTGYKGKAADLKENIEGAVGGTSGRVEAHSSGLSRGQQLLETDIRHLVEAAESGRAAGAGATAGSAGDEVRRGHYVLFDEAIREISNGKPSGNTRYQDHDRRGAPD